ncbi:ATP-binding protein, partial [Streptomyces sp. NPDC058953]
APPGAAVPAPAAMGAGPDDDVPLVTERTPGGLPQRRRKAPAPDLTAPVAAAPRSEQPKEAPQVQPGIWLAAFHSGLAGEDPQTNKGSTQP